MATRVKSEQLGLAVEMDSRVRGNDGLLLAIILVFSLFAAPPAFAAKTMFSGLTSIDEIQKTLSKLPESRASRKKAKLHSDLGTLLYRKGQMAEAAKEFEVALTFATTRTMRRHIYLFMGKSYDSSGRLDRAISAYEEALEYDRHNWKRHRDLANLYEQAELYKKAREYYANARTLNPREPSLTFVGGRVFRKIGLYKQAEEFQLKAREMGYDRNAIHRELSMIYSRRGRPADALSEWKAGAGDSEALDDIARTVYLAVLADDRAGAKAALPRLKAAGASPETVQLYENLVELDSSALTDPQIDALVGSFLAERKAP